MTKNREMAERGRQGGLKGGKARAKKLSAKRRQEIARKGGLARGKKAGAAQRRVASQVTAARAAVDAPLDRQPKHTGVARRGTARRKKGARAGAAQGPDASHLLNEPAGAAPDRPEGDVRQVKDFMDRGLAAQAAVDTVGAGFTPKPATPGHSVHCQCVRCRAARGKAKEA